MGVVTGRLILVATPIGNLGDLSLRAAEVLRDADVIAAEDTRRTGRLLAHIGVETPQVSYHEHNERERAPELLRRIAGGDTVALVTDAGTPSVSDPGFRLVRQAVVAGLPVEAIPGPSAVVHALVVSGLPTDRFAFDGFLPRRPSARRGRLAQLADEPRTVVVYVSPHRAVDDLRDLSAALGEDRPAALCRELTKLHEEVVRGSLAELVDTAERDGVKGEATLVIAGAPARTPPELAPSEMAEEVALRVAAGLTKKAAIAEVAGDLGVPKRDVYQAVVDAGGS